MRLTATLGGGKPIALSQPPSPWGRFAQGPGPSSRLVGRKNMRTFVMALLVLCGIGPLTAAAQPGDDPCERLQADLEPDRLIVIPGDRSGHVVTGKGRLYFHSAPADACRSGIFIIPGDTVDAVEAYDDFLQATYVNPRSGESTTGWLPSHRLEPTGEGIAPRQ